MKIQSLKIIGLKKFFTEITFDFSQAMNLNTISGKNGSGKTTIADALLVLQQAFFLLKLEEKYPNNEFTIKANKAFMSKLIDLSCSSRISIKAAFIDGDNVIEIELVAEIIGVENVKYEIIMTDEHKNILEAYWNPENPTNVLIYIESDKYYNETKTPFSEINIKTKYDIPVSREAWLTVNMVFFPSDTFHILYKNLLMDWAYERLIPTKGKQDLYYKLATAFFNIYKF